MPPKTPTRTDAYVQCTCGGTMTIVMVEQNFRFAAPLSDRFYVMEHGRVVDAFSSPELASREKALHTLLGV